MKDKPINDIANDYINRLGGRPRHLDHDVIAQYLLDNPLITSDKAAEYFGCSKWTLLRIAAEKGIRKEWSKKK